MAKTMRVPVLVIEHKEDIEMLMRGLHLVQDYKTYDDPPEAKKKIRGAFK